MLMAQPVPTPRLRTKLNKSTNTTFSTLGLKYYNNDFHNYIVPLKSDNLLSAINVTSQNNGQNNQYKSLYNTFNNKPFMDDELFNSCDDTSVDEHEHSLIGQLSNNSIIVSKQASDSLDNNCIYREADCFESFKELLDRFEAKTVERYRKELLKTHEHIDEKIMGPVKTEFYKVIGDDENDDIKLNKLNIRTNYPQSSYYSEYFGVNKPLYNNSYTFLEKNLNNCETSNGHLFRAVRCSTTDVSSTKKATSENGKVVSNLVDYFESVKENNETIVSSKNDVQTKIFEEVLNIRDRENIIYDRELAAINMLKYSVQSNSDEIIPPPSPFDTKKILLNDSIQLDANPDYQTAAQEISQNALLKNGVNKEMDRTQGIVIEKIEGFRNCLQIDRFGIISSWFTYVMDY